MQEGLNHFEANNLGGMLPDGEGGKGKRGGGNLLHDPSHKKDFDQVRDWWIQARTRLSSARYEMALDDDFYDGLQWREQDLLVLEERGQPALVFNQIKPVIDWIIGTEKRTRFDWNVLPREDSDRTAAEAKTKLLKYTDDVNHAQMARSRAFADAVRVGLGWLEAGIRNDPTDEPLYSRSESWRNMWWDDLSEELDYSDARYVFRSRWVDLDIAQAMFPDNKGELAAAARTHDLFGGTDEDGDGFQLYYQTDAQGRPVEVRSYTEDASYAVTNRRSRVRLVECWYRKPVPRKVVHMFDRKHRDYARMHGMPLRSNEDQAAAKPLVEEGLARDDRIAHLVLDALGLAGDRRGHREGFLDPGFAFLVDRLHHRATRDDGEVHGDWPGPQGIGEAGAQGGGEDTPEQPAAPLLHETATPVS